MDREKAIERIKKCLRLSKSSNEFEAAAAMRQAQKLMAEHQITDDDMLASEVSEERTRSQYKRAPINWEWRLARVVADAFACRVLYSSGVVHGQYLFIGCGASPQVAVYAYVVLARQLRRARARHVRTSLKRFGTRNRTRQADLFCVGWVTAVHGLVEDFAGAASNKAAIEVFMQRNYEIGQSDAASRIHGRGSARDADSYLAGLHDGRSAELRRGVDGASPAARLVGPTC